MSERGSQSPNAPSPRPHVDYQRTPMTGFAEDVVRYVRRLASNTTRHEPKTAEVERFQLAVLTYKETSQEERRGSQRLVGKHKRELLSAEYHTRDPEWARLSSSTAKRRCVREEDKHSQVGEDHQPAIPDCTRLRPSVDNFNKVHLDWSPMEDGDEAVQKLTDYLSSARNLLFDWTTSTFQEHALKTLKSRDYSFKEALDELKQIPPEPSDTKDGWSETEKFEFETGFFLWGKNFKEIQRHKVPTKTVEEIVRHYYKWKMTQSYKDYRANAKKGTTSNFEQALSRTRSNGSVTRSQVRASSLSGTTSRTSSLSAPRSISPVDPSINRPTTRSKPKTTGHLTDWSAPLTMFGSHPQLPLSNIPLNAPLPTYMQQNSNSNSIYAMPQMGQNSNSNSWSYMTSNSNSNSTNSSNRVSALYSRPILPKILPNQCPVQSPG